jgi:hypothetical protein
MGVRSVNNSLQQFLDTFVRSGTDAVGPGGPFSGLTATGGVISDYTDPGPGAIYRAHIFTSSGTFDVSSIGSYGSNVEYLVVAGGGSGGVAPVAAGGRGGGGAGGLRSNHPDMPAPLKASPFSISVASYPVTVGSGGAGGNSGENTGTKGVDSTFSTIISSGGGGGGYYYSGSTFPSIKDGGSGGGDYDAGPVGSGNIPPSSPPQGNPGGTGNGGTPAGGGGGAGAPGSSSSGGNGLPLSITGIATHYAGGGGGGAWGSGGPGAGPGGLGGGGNGTKNGRGIDGTFSTGGGGGGSGGIPGGSLYPGSNGGSGIVVVRYQIGQLTATAKATGGLISYYGGKTIHTFTSSGTFTTPGTFNETVEYVVIGGGGAGGQQGGNDDGHGGGAAGSYRTGTTPISTPQTITVQVGSGAANSPHPAGTGTASFFGPPITAPGGGSGGGSAAGVAGGSAGGGSAGGPGYPGGTATTPSSGWGHNGGSAGSGGGPGGGGGGGGGAGGVGTNNAGAGNAGSPGGAGIQIPSTFRNPAFVSPGSNKGFGGAGPTSAPTPNGFDTSGNFWFAAGGGGGTWGYVGPQVGGVGGGPAGPYAGAGNGASQNPTGASPRVVATSGLENTGSGGGGGTSNANPFLLAGKGGSGIVLIAYPS